MDLEQDVFAHSGCMIYSCKHALLDDHSGKKSGGIKSGKSSNSFLVIINIIGLQTLHFLHWYSPSCSTPGIV